MSLYVPWMSHSFLALTAEEFRRDSSHVYNSFLTVLGFSGPQNSNLEIQVVSLEPRKLRVWKKAESRHLALSHFLFFFSLGAP